jgi:PhnB protein
MTATKNPVVEPYLFFEGRCEEAVEFYRKALGAEVVMMMRFKDSPDPNAAAHGKADKIMHASFRVGDTLIMASDGRAEDPMKFEGFALSIAVATPPEVDRYFNALTPGGQVIMPLAKTFWSPRFGMVTDRFGIMWMISVMHEMPA